MKIMFKFKFFFLSLKKKKRNKNSQKTKFKISYAIMSKNLKIFNKFQKPNNQLKAYYLN